MQHVLWIRNGTIITAHGSVEADVWVCGGKIRRVARDTLFKWPLESSAADRVTVIDATDMYLLPGFIVLTELPLGTIRAVRDYVALIRQLVRYGYTFMHDTLHVEGWMIESQVQYLKAPHYNNLIDYSIGISLEAIHLQADKVRSLCQQNFRLFTILVRRPEDLRLIPWDELTSLHSQYRFSLHLQLPEDARISKDERVELLKAWMRMCRKAKVRSCIPAVDPYELTEQEPFYLVTRLKGEKAGRVMEHIARYPHRTLAAFAGLTDIIVDVRRRKWSLDELLSMVVRLASTNIAKAIGVYPRKGCLAPGADADILFLKKEDLLTKLDLSTILKLSEHHLPASVMSNGRWIYREDSFAPTIGMGRCLQDAKPYNYVI